MVTALVYDSGVGPGNLTPLEELKQLDQQIDRIGTLEGLQPLFVRLEEITKANSGDFEVQLVAHDVKQHILSRGSRIKQMQPPPLAAAPPPVTPPTPVAVSEPAAPKKRSKALVWGFAALLVMAGIAIGVNVILNRNRQLAQTAPVDAKITTVPPGAAIAIEGQQGCTADCVAKLPPGKYPVTATLDGYEPATVELTVTASTPATLNIPLTPMAVSARIFADLGIGKVFLDDQPAGELLDGQFTFAHLEPGQHTIRVTGGKYEASFSLTAAPLAMPVIEGPIQTKELLAVLVTNMGDRARVATSSGPLSVMLNGQQESESSPLGVDLTTFKTGPAEFEIGEGPKKRTITGTFGPAPTLTAFLKSDERIGTLIITTGTDDAKIFLNGKEQKRRTEKGQARLQTFGDVTVRVEKPGFEPVPVQTAKVEQGGETRLTFTMKPVPQYSALTVNAVPGTQVLLSDRPLGTVGSDGALRNSTIAPGEHSIELRRDQFEPKRLTRTFRAGETVVIGGAEATLAAVPPPVVATLPPPPKIEPAPVKPAPKARASGTIANFDNPGAWQQAEGIWRHRGAATLTYGLQPDGIFTFSIYMLKGGGVFGGGKVRWVMNYVDSKNYSQFELDQENFWAKVIRNGKESQRKKLAHKQDKSMRVWNIQIDVSPTRIIHKIQGDNGWEDLDNWSEPGRDFTQGKFGILVQGSDEVGLSNFSFTGR